MGQIRRYNVRSGEARAEGKEGGVLCQNGKK